MHPFPISPPELLRRRVLFAVDVIDPLTSARVSAGIRVTADELAGRPIVNRSGYFVWLAEADTAPEKVTVRVIPEKLPFEEEIRDLTDLPPPPPADETQPFTLDKLDKRVLRIVLRPTAVYPFPDDATVIYGCMRETEADDAPPVPGLDVRLQWLEPKRWLEDDTFAAAEWKSSPAAGLTTAAGEFAAALCLPNGAKTEGGPSKVTVRVLFQRDTISKCTAKQETLPGSRVVPQGAVGKSGVLAWNKLNPLPLQ